jgi:hypothetical protein
MKTLQTLLRLRLMEAPPSPLAEPLLVVTMAASEFIMPSRGFRTTARQHQRY